MKKKKTHGFFILLLFLLVGVVVAFFRGICFNYESSDKVSESQEKSSDYSSREAVDPFSFNILSYSMFLKNYGNSLKNSVKAAEIVNGMILQPGERFSAYECFGCGGKKEGFFYAKVAGGAMGYGGGICRTLSALYVAALVADFNIVDRSCHSEVVDYGIVGLDSAFSFDLKKQALIKNLEFVNNRSYPIKISIEIKKTDDGEDNILTVCFKCGKKLTEKRTVEFNSEIFDGGSSAVKKGNVRVVVREIVRKNGKIDSKKDIENLYMKIDKKIDVKNLKTNLEQDVYF